MDGVELGEDGEGLMVVVVAVNWQHMAN